MVASCRWELKGSVNLAKASPGLKELQLYHCNIKHRHGVTSDGELKLEHLSLSCCSWSECDSLPFLSPHLKILNISETAASNDDLWTIVSPSHS